MVAQRQLEDTVLIVVKWGFESLVSSHRLLLNLVGGITMPLRCFLFSVLLVCEDRLISCF